MIKKDWFSDLEILESHQKINYKQDSNTVSDISGINKKTQTNRNEQPVSENGNIKQPNNAQPNNPEQTLTREQKVNLEQLKRIMGSEKVTSPL